MLLKMPRNSIRLQSVFIFLLIFGRPIFIEYCESLTNENYVHESQGSPSGEEGYAFFALRSCHQVMRGDGGEFFSPDYLCSNPPLWCNWTIQVDPGKRVQLYLEDFTPGDACHLKLDQVHLDGVSGGSGVLEKCWRSVRYQSLSNTLHVVLLIGASPVITPYRGFYGWYQAFGPPVAYKSHKDDDGEGDGKWLDEDSGPRVTEPPMVQRNFDRYVPMKEGEPTQAILLKPNYEATYDYFDQPASASNELPLDVEGEPMGREGTYTWSTVRSDAAGEDHLEDGPTVGGTWNHSGHFGPASFRTATPALTPPLSHAEEDVHTPTSRTPTAGVQTPLARRPALSPGPSRNPPSAVRRNADAAHTQEPPPPPTSPAPAEPHDRSRTTDADPGAGPPSVSALAADRAEDAAVETAADEPLGSDTPTPSETLGTTGEPLPNMVEPLSDSRGRGSTINHTEVPHLPGGHLFEVSVELTFSSEDESDEHWDRLARSLLMSTQALIQEQLVFLSTPVAMSAKRIKRLSAGVLYIIWLQTEETPDALGLHSIIHAALQELISTNVPHSGSPRQAVLVSVSTMDVNECGTQLVLCDVNAECVNGFGSYTCHCRAGFEDMSRPGGTGGTICVDLKAAGCRWSQSAGAVQGVYALSFLLGFLILLLLAAVGVLYRRRRGAFLVPPPTPARNGKKKNNNNGDNGSFHTDTELPPPPPPIRRPREGWSHPKDCCPAVDLPLLRFSPLLPLDGYIEPGEAAKM